MIKSLYLILVLLMIVAPAAIQFTVKDKIGYLSGVEPKKEIDSISWWKGTWQQNAEQLLRDSSRLLTDGVRIKNQLEFSLFNKINAQDLYHYDGVFYRYTSPAYNETNEFVGLDTIQHRVQLLKEFSDQFHIPVYVIFTPNKMRMYQEHLPKVNRINSTKTNYFHYKKALLRAGIPVLDAQAWFLSVKDKLPHPVIAKQGVHWTQYAAGLTFDSLIKRVSADQKKDFQRLDPKWNPKGEFFIQDIDLAELCNLVFTPRDSNLISASYPTDRIKKRQLRTMLLSDSFFHAVSWSQMDLQILDPRSTFYFYYHTRFNQKLAFNPPNHAQIAEDLKDIDCMIILNDIQNLSNFGFGFIDDYAKKHIQKSRK